MQRGIIRRRSSFDDQGGDSDRLHQRPRLSSGLASPSQPTPTAIITTSTEEPSSPPPRAMGPPRTGNGALNGASTEEPSSPPPRAMGPPRIGNGALNGATRAAAAADQPGDALLSQVERFYPLGDLMYEDDADWTNEDDADIVMEPSHTGGSEDHGQKARRQQKFGRRMPVDREEVVRLMLQGLQDIGYHQAAAVLAKESGYSLATPAAEDFQAAVLGGRWSEATALLPDLGLEDTVISSEPSSSSSSITSGKVKATGQENAMDRARFLIAKQKYLEFLEAGNQKKALGVLRNELATSATDSEALHDLSGFMMCLDRDDLYERAKWDGAAGISRRQLLERLQEHISPEIMVPSRRLATLLDQARQHQKQACLYHDDMSPISLYHDHVCKSGTFPSVTTHVLADHHDEVWRIEWSPNGNLLASASKDKTVVIWQLQPPSAGNKRQYSMVPLHRLKGHRGPVDALAWSPDGETLVTAADKQIFVWNAKTGEKSSVTVDSQLADTVSAIQWMPDGSQFIVSSMDCTIIFYDVTGKIVHKWLVRSLQIGDFAITPDGTRIVAVTTAMRRVSVQNKLKPTISARIIEDDFHYGNMNRGLTVMRIADREIIDYVADIKATDVTSLKLSHDGQRVLVSCAPDELQVFGLDPHLHMLRKFVGHVQSRFLIRSAFGAPKDRFILSGSEDGNVYVWQSNSTTPLEVLAGHADTVNAVAWNPILSRKLFASCSDDTTIRIWQPPLQDTEKVEAAGVEEEGIEL